MVAFCLKRDNKQRAREREKIKAPSALLLDECSMTQEDPWKERRQGTPFLFSSVQSSVMSDCLRPMDCSTKATFSVTNYQSLLKLTSIKSVISSNHLILCHPLFLPFSIFPSIRVFSNESVLCIRWPEYWSFSFSISPSKEYSGLISYRMNWLDLLAVQGTLQESSPTPQFKSINSSVLSFFYSPSLTSIRDNWKNHSFD